MTTESPVLIIKKFPSNSVLNPFIPFACSLFYILEFQLCFYSRFLQVENLTAKGNIIRVEFKKCEREFGDREEIGMKIIERAVS